MMNFSLNRCCAKVNLTALERNIGRIRTILPSHVRYMAVVKADAYGHGMQATVNRLMHSSVDAFAVANITEGVSIRKLGCELPILVLGPTLPEERPAQIDYSLIATISSKEEIDALNKLARQRNKKQTIHLKIDTGMGRAGAYFTNAAELIQDAKDASHLVLDGVYTHLSCADCDPDFTRLQRNRFFDILKSSKIKSPSPLWIHIDNSAGLETLAPNCPINAVRVGLLQYGHLPASGPLLKSLQMEPVMSLETRLVMTKHLPTGTPISYGATHVLKRDSRIGILAAGYRDGISTAMSNNGEVLLRGLRVPIIGRITMDQTIVDLTDHPDAQTGDRVIFLGKDGNETIDLETFAARNGKNLWEALCSISAHVPRIYKEDI